MHGNPRQQDPEWPRVEAARCETSHRKGVVWANPLSESEIIYYIVRWKEFAALERLHEGRHALLGEREKRIGAWVANRFRHEGMAIFDSTKRETNKR